MSHGDVQAIGIVVADGLPVDGPGSKRHAAGGLERFEVVGFEFVGVGCHHLGQPGPAGLQPYEDEALEHLQLDRRQAPFVQAQVRISLAQGYADEPAFQVVGPGVVGTDDAAALAGGSIE
jgi:hypothetical protein